MVFDDAVDMFLGSMGCRDYIPSVVVDRWYRSCFPDVV